MFLYDIYKQQFTNIVCQYRRLNEALYLQYMIPSIHEASPLEIEIIQSLIQRIWKPTYREILSEEQMDYMLGRMYDPLTLRSQMDEGHHFLLLNEDNSPVGFAGYQFDYPEKGICKLHKIYLLPETQGKGLGKMLIHEVIERAEQEGQQSLSLNVNRHNKALNFYKNYGFEIKGEEDINIGNGYFMNDYIMEYKLNPEIQITAKDAKNR
jgi:ribosomal protein S18 acetylase RimI-like enzyme